MITELDQRGGGRRYRPDLGDPPPRDRLVRCSQAHHAAGLGHIDRRDPFHDRFMFLDMHLDRLLHRCVLLFGPRLAWRAARGDRWDSQNLTGVLVATVRNPSRAPAPDRPTASHATETTASGGQPRTKAFTPARRPNGT